MQPVLQGFDKPASLMGLMERSTAAFIAGFFDERQKTIEAAWLCDALISVAQATDILTNKGRDTSRQHTALLNYFNRLLELYPEQKHLDDDVAGLLAQSQVKSE